MPTIFPMPMQTTISDDWINIHFKEYPRFEQVKLPRNFLKSRMKLQTAIERRRSKRNFSCKNLSLRKFSTLLHYSSGITHRDKDLNLTRRAYPSAGARYAIEVYAIILLNGEIKQGLYHYNVKRHSLELLMKGQFQEVLEDSIVDKDLAKAATAFLIITAVPSRTLGKYKQNGDKFILLEAGHLVQNTYLIGEALGISCCAVGACNEEKMNGVLDINGTYERIIYLVALGTP